MINRLRKKSKAALGISVAKIIHFNKLAISVHLLVGDNEAAAHPENYREINGAGTGVTTDERERIDVIPRVQAQ